MIPDPRTYFEEVGVLPKKGGGITTYVSGFILSLLLTIFAYYLASAGLLSWHMLFISLGILACVQFAVQAVCFLHLGKEATARERLLFLGLSIIVVFILVAGSIWIMFSLNDRMMPTTMQMEEFMESQSGL